MDRQRDGQRRRPLRVHSHVSRRRQQQPAALHRSRQRRRAERRRGDQADRRNARCRIHADRQLPIAPLPALATRTRRTAASSRSISSTPIPAPGRSSFPSSRTRSKHAALDRRPHRHPLPRGRAEPAASCSALDGHAEGDIALPGIGAVSELYGRRDQYDVWFSFSSPLSPATVYRYDLEARRAHARSRRPSRRSIASQFETHAMFATSKDGTRVPFFLTSKKGLQRDGRNPTMLYGYGGFSISVLPALSIGCAGVARAWRRVRVGEHARRRRVRRELAQGRLPRTASRTCSTTSSPSPST